MVFVSSRLTRSVRVVRALCTVVALAAAVAAATPETLPKEYPIKAAFLYNFTKFVEWQAKPVADTTEPIVIGVVGRDPFGGELQDVVRGRKVNGRTITVLTIDSAEELRPVHVAFVAEGGEALFERLRASLEAGGALTVGESERFAELGGIITFVLARDKIRFEIDMDAAERSRLRISAQLQKLARHVRRSGP